MSALVVQIRRNTRSGWANTVLKSGEIGLETDTGTLRVGDGSTPWQTLPSISGGAIVSTFSDLRASTLTISTINGLPYASGGTLTGITAGTGITVDNTNPAAPLVANAGVISLTAGSNILINNTDPANPTITALSNSVFSTITDSQGNLGTSGQVLGIANTPGYIRWQTPSTAVISTFATLSVSALTNVSTINGAPYASGGTLTGITAGTGITVDNTNPAAPIVANAGVISLTAGSNILINNTDPANPSIAALANSVFSTLQTSTLKDSNGNLGTPGQVLGIADLDGNIAWQIPSTATSTFDTLLASSLTVDTLTVSSIVDSNGSIGTTGQVLTTNGQYVSWTNPGSGPASNISTFADLYVSSLNVDVLQGSTISNTIVVNASLIPALDNTYDLGAVGSSFRHLYVAGSTIFLGNATISADVEGNVYTTNVEGYSTSVTSQLSSFNTLSASSIQALALTEVSSINGLPYSSGGGGGPTISSFNDLSASTIQTSTLVATSEIVVGTGVIGGGGLNLNGTIIGLEKTDYSSAFLDLGLGGTTELNANGSDGGARAIVLNGGIYGVYIGATGANTGSNSLSSILNVEYIQGQAGVANEGVAAINMSVSTITNVSTINGVPYTGMSGSNFVSENFTVATDSEGGIIYSYDGITWNTNSAATAVVGTCKAVAWNGSYWMAVGDGVGTTPLATIATSPDGINWTSQTDSILGSGRAVAWNGSIWVAVGSGIIFSSDGVNWTPAANDPFSPNPKNGVAWNGRYWVVVGNGITSTQAIATSPDGLNWTLRSSPFDYIVGRNPGIVNTIAWNGTVWAAGGEFAQGPVGDPLPTSIAISTDGITWSQGSNVPPVTITSIAWNGIKWLAFTPASNQVITSMMANGSVWGTMLLTGATGLSSVTWNGSLWLVAGTSSSGAILATSPDGETWTYRTTSLSTQGKFIASRRVLPFTYNLSADTLYANALTISTINGLPYSSGGGGSTSTISTFATLNTSSLQVSTINGLPYIAPTLSENFTVAAIEYSLYYSYNGITWSRSSGLNEEYRTIIWNGSYWLAGGPENSGIASLRRSSDGIKWSSNISSPFSTIYGLAWNGSLWVAVGDGSGSGTGIATSPDGITWTDSINDPFLINSKYGVAWNGSYWVVVGNRGVGGTAIATSYDGMNWTARTTPFKNAEDIVWNGSLWIAVGITQAVTPLIAISPDGINWTTRTSPLTAPANVIGWNGSILLAAAGPEIVRSLDGGMTWEAVVNFPTSIVSIAGISWNGSLWIVSGNIDTAIGQPIPAIVTSPDTVTWTGQPSSAAIALGGTAVASRRVLPFSSNFSARTLYADSLTISSINGLPYSSGGGGGPSTTISSFNDLHTSTLEVSSINGLPYTPGTAAAAGPPGAIQYTDGNGVFQASSTFFWSEATAAIHGGPPVDNLNSNNISFDAGGNLAIVSNQEITLDAVTGGGRNITLNASTIQILLSNSSGNAGQVLTSDGQYATWQTPSGGGGGPTISSFNDLHTSTLEVSSINGLPYTPGTAAAAGPPGAIQYTDGNGNFQGSSSFRFNTNDFAIEVAQVGNRIALNQTGLDEGIPISGNMVLQSIENIVLLASTSILLLNSTGTSLALANDNIKLFVSHGNMNFDASTLEFYVGGSQGAAGEVLTSDGQYATWQPPSGGGGPTISSFNDLHTSTLEVSSINGHPYTPGTAAAAGPLGAIQYTDGNGVFQGSSIFLWDPSKSQLTVGPASNTIGFDDGVEGSSISITSVADINLNATFGNIALSPSTLQISLPTGGSGSAGQVLTSDGEYATWQTPSGGGGGPTISSFDDLRTSTLHVMSEIAVYGDPPESPKITIDAKGVNLKGAAIIGFNLADYGSGFLDLGRNDLAELNANGTLGGIKSLALNGGSDGVYIGISTPNTNMATVSSILNVDYIKGTSSGSGVVQISVSTLIDVSSINGHPYAPGTAAAAGPLGAIQYTDGNGVFQGSSIFSWDPSKSQLTAGSAGNSIEFGSGPEHSSITIYTPADFSITAITGNILLNPSTLQISLLSGGSGTVGQVLTSDGVYATWQTPSGGGGGTTISSFNDLHTSTLQVSTINGISYSGPTLSENFCLASNALTQPNGGVLAYSYDGIKWSPTNYSFSSNGAPKGIAWNGSYWLMAGNTLTSISSDGINWISSATGCPATSFGWNGSMWVGVGPSMAGDIGIYISLDGLNWTLQNGNDNTVPSGVKNGIAWNGSYWVVVGGNPSTANTTTIATSPDGVNWTARVCSVLDTKIAYGIAWNGYMWIAAGEPSGVGTIQSGVALSYDGITWAAPTVPPFSGGECKTITWNGSIWLTTNDGRSVSTSLTGETWTTPVVIPGAGKIRNITWNGSLWIAIGPTSTSSIMATSPDGINWTAINTTPPFPTNDSTGSLVVSRRVLPFSNNISARSLYAPILNVSTINGLPYSTDAVSTFTTINTSTLTVSSINGLNTTRSMGITEIVLQASPADNSYVLSASDVGSLITLKGDGNPTNTGLFLEMKFTNSSVSPFPVGGTFFIKNIDTRDNTVTVKFNEIEIDGPNASLYSINQNGMNLPLTNGYLCIGHLVLDGSAEKLNIY